MGPPAWPWWPGEPVGRLPRCSCSAPTWGAVGTPAWPGRGRRRRRPTDSAYGLIDSAGGIMTFGGAGYYGDTLEVPLAQADRGRARPTRRAGTGWWPPTGASSASATPGSSVPWAARRSNEPIVGMAATPDGGGYWLVASDGGIFCFGDAGFFGSPAASPSTSPSWAWGHARRRRVLAGGLRRRDLHLRRRGVLGLDRAASGSTSPSSAWRRPATATGTGWWPPTGASSASATPASSGRRGAGADKPIVGMAATPDGGGYWLVASDAGVFTFGDAVFSGSAQSPEHPPLLPARVVGADRPGGGDHQRRARAARRPTRAGCGWPSRVTRCRSSRATTWPRASRPTGSRTGREAGCGYTNGAPTIPWGHPSTDIYLSQPACAAVVRAVQWWSRASIPT